MPLNFWRFWDILKTLCTIGGKLATHPTKINRVFKFIYRRDLEIYCLMVAAFCFTWVLACVLIYLYEAHPYQRDPNNRYLYYPLIITVPLTTLFFLYIVATFGKKEYILAYIASLVRYFRQSGHSEEKFFSLTKELLLHLSTQEYPEDVSVLLIKRDGGLLNVVRQFGIYPELIGHPVQKTSIANYSLELDKFIVEKNIEWHEKLDRSYKDKIRDPDKYIKSIIAIPITKSGCVIEYVSHQIGVFVETKETRQLLGIIRDEYIRKFGP